MEESIFAHEEKVFAGIDPLDSGRMGGIEKFTIRRVGNPIVENGRVNLQAAQILHALMNKKIGGRIRIPREENSTANLRFYSKLAPKIDRLGKVDMETVTAQRYEIIERTSDALVDELLSYSQESARVIEVFDLFWARVAQLDYTPADLMSTLLICAQEKRFETEPEIVTNFPKGGAAANTRLEVVVGTGNGEKKVSIRVVSVREMLREYFERHPARYTEAIEKCTGVKMNGAKNGAKIIEESIARMGVWEFAVSVWMQVRGWDMERALENGIIAPIDENEEWILCPKWRDYSATVGELAKLIAQQTGAI